MSHSSIREYVNSEESSSDDWLKSFRDGITFKTHEFFKKYPQALRIQLYYDDFVVNNPLGSKVHSHKLGAFYFIIQNLPSYFNSFLGGIHLLILCYMADVEKYGMKAVLQPFLNDLRHLESDEGIEININGKILVLRASLAAHQLLGFLSPSAIHFCHLCMITRTDHQHNVNLPVVLRSKNLHEKQLQNIKNIKPVKDCINARKKSGIKEESALHMSRYFHCTNNFVFDPMHDIFEGIAPYEIKLVLHHFITVKSYDFNLDLFNSRIHLFQYGIHEIKNKPSANFTVSSVSYNLKDHKISQTSAQT